MSILVHLVDLILTAVVALDTIGFLVNLKKNKESHPKDFYRITFTWIVFMVLKSLSCGCSGTLGFLWNSAVVGLKAFVAIPKTGGAEKLNSLLVEQNIAVQYAKLAFDIVKEKLGSATKVKNN
jgi:hypothetical protein